MKFVFCTDRTGGTVGMIYYYYDTSANRIGKCSYNYLVEDLFEFYGFEKIEGVAQSIGYNYIPYKVYGRVSKENCVTVLGKLLNEDKVFLVITPKGDIKKMTEAELICFSIRDRVTNIVKSKKFIKLRKGKMPLLQEDNKEVVDSIEKIRDIDLYEAQLGSVGTLMKFFGYRKRDRRVGVVKYSLGDILNDNINEVICYKLGKLFGVNVCEASLEIYEGKHNCVISLYEYEPYKEYLRTCKSVFGTEHFKSDFSVSNIERLFSKKAADDFKRMVIFDCLTFQEDRHISNFAFIDNRMYPLYDNGRSLFWNRTDSEIKDIIERDVIRYIKKNEHGYGFPYVDGVLGIFECRRLIKNDVKFEGIYDIISYWYEKERAMLISKSIYRVYCIIMGVGGGVLK